MRHANQTCGLATFQVAPRLPLALRPSDGRYPSASASWYRNLSFGPGSELDILWYGGGHFDSLGAYFPMRASSHTAHRRGSSLASSAQTVPSLEPADQGSSSGATLDAASRSSNSLLRFEYEPGPTGFMRWYVDGALTFEVLASSLGSYRAQSGERVGTRLIPEEPLYLILSVAVSRTFSGTVDEAMFPTVMRVGHVRIYQLANRPQKAQCSPLDHPTDRWIKEHWWASFPSHSPPTYSTCLRALLTSARLLHRWANGRQAPPEVDSLLRVDHLAYGALGALGFLALLEGRDKEQTRLPLALLFGASLTAAVASSALSRYLGVGEHGELNAAAISDPSGKLAHSTSVLASAGEAVTSLATFLRLASPERNRESSLDRNADLEHELAQTAIAAKVVADHLVYLACVFEAAVVGGLLLTILSDVTLALATAYAACILSLQLYRSSFADLLTARFGLQTAFGDWWAGESGITRPTSASLDGTWGASGAAPPAAPSLISPPPDGSETTLSLALLPLFFTVVLASGLAAIHVRAAATRALHRHQRDAQRPEARGRTGCAHALC